MQFSTVSLTVCSLSFLCSCTSSLTQPQQGTLSIDHMEFYRQQSESTDPGEYAPLYEKLPSSLEAVLRRINDVLLSSFPAENMTEQQQNDINARTTQDILKALKERGNSFTSRGAQETRFVGLCYHWSALAASVLRSKGFTCRVRCGFAPYLNGNKTGVDHTVIELWDPQRGRWRLIDPELISISPEASPKILKVQETLDPLDISYQRFHLAATAWLNYRQKVVPDGFYGLFDDEPSYGFVRTSLIRDWLNILGHERNVSCGPPLRGLSQGQELVYLDRIANLMLEPDKNFETLKKLSSDIDFDFPKTAEDESSDLRPIPKE